MRLADPPTALFVASIASDSRRDRQRLQYYGIVVPDDVSLICFDDAEWFCFTVPKITVISSSQSRLAEAAVTLLLTWIEEPEQRGRRRQPDGAQVRADAARFDGQPAPDRTRLARLE